MKPKVLIFYSQLNIGGAERSNLRLMEYLVTNGWNVTLLLKYGNGSLEKEIPKSVKVIHLADYSYYTYIEKSKTLIQTLNNILKYCFRIFLQKIREWKKLNEMKMNYSYDLAVIGLQGLSPKPIIKYIKASKMLLWIRNDLLLCDPSGKVKHNIEKFNKFIDYFPCVSLTAYNSFCKKFPSLRSKALIFYNIINAKEMINKSKLFIPEDIKINNILRIITVCRISDKSKGIFRMINVYKKLRDDGYLFYWYLIGDGPDLDEANRKVNQYNLQDGFVFLGRKENPFPYYKFCNLSATLSYYEGLCGAVNEAKIMGLPVIATEFSGIHEQIEHGKNGWIVKNSEEAIYNGLKKLICDKNLLLSITNNYLPNVIKNDEYKEKILLDICQK